MVDIIRFWKSQVLANSITASLSAHQVFKLTVNIHVSSPQLHVIDNLGMKKQITVYYTVAESGKPTTPHAMPMLTTA